MEAIDARVSMAISLFKLLAWYDVMVFFWFEFAHSLSQNAPCSERRAYVPREATDWEA